ncbi:4Fe-4S dicluster domain-containing protein [Lachnospiraceae bacterium MD1]|uniref:4Fe-4S dicluster domain-containing protein n=1 Tax=Variimorphobacter saccharofermentans TaxID=2755051 RepID=A0A839JY20_9FIRM|nr:[Fe-Fe] hydrogenase large subunit C-terminal domain-containing protein [Variimorphobacter saccharofermentans]MBB2181381.1 4Fe-4S dicluster domain-containing protein [Variimorphobacter saccharofermentans]
MGKFYTSVRLKEDLCMGCINCIKRCPTQAIRVRNQKAVITKEFCIDCGECIRICPHHAKEATYDTPDIMKNYEYTIALPAPSLYGQFNHLEDVNIVLTALKRMGFDDVYEVSGAAEMVSELSREYVREHQEKWPLISTACPSVVRLIQVRFPNLIEHLLPIIAPVDMAASEAVKMAMKKTGLPREKIGVIFISPCPAKMTAVKSPIGIEKSEIDGVLAIKEVYPILLPLMKQCIDDVEELGISGRIGIGWGSTGGEAGSLLTDNYLAADGIENVIKVLEDLEDQKFDRLEFIELNACAGGCVGGVLTVENPYLAKVKLQRLRKYLPVSCSHLVSNNTNGYWTNDVNYEPVFKLGNDMKESIANMSRVEELCEKFPRLDCGSCGAPTCKALAEDIVRGVANEKDCIHILRDYIHRLSDELSRLDTKK